MGELEPTQCATGAVVGGGRLRHLEKHLAVADAPDPVAPLEPVEVATAVQRLDELATSLAATAGQAVALGRGGVVRHVDHEACPECGTEDALAACGPGVERLQEEVTALFPEQRTRVVSSDTLTGPAAAEEFVRGFPILTI